MTPKQRNAFYISLAEQGGFISADALTELEDCEAGRLDRVLVRFENGRRLVTTVQDARNIIDALELAGWYCRDMQVAGGVNGARRVAA